MTNPWWICEDCGLVVETRTGHRPAKLKCKCGGDILPDYSAEAEYVEGYREVQEFNARIGPCPDLKELGLGWDDDNPTIH
jgi:hypothetical protein